MMYLKTFFISTMVFLGLIHGSGQIVGSSVFSTQQGGTGTSTIPASGQVLLGQSNGTYAVVATSALGIVGGGGSGITNAYASSTFPTFSYGSSSYLNANSIVNVSKLSTSTSGYVLQSLGNTAQWVATGTLGISGGSGSPAGADTQIQYNNAGNFGASANLTYSAGGFTTQYGAGSGGKLTVGTLGIALWDQTNSNILDVFSSVRPGVILTSSTTGAANGNYAMFNTSLQSANHTFSFPNKDGTFAMTSDIPSLNNSWVHIASAQPYITPYLSHDQLYIGGNIATSSSVQIINSEYNNTTAMPAYAGNWNLASVWGIGPKSTSSADNTILLSSATNFDSAWTANSTLIFEAPNFSFPGIVYDSTHASGTSNQTLYSTGTSTLWATAPWKISGTNVSLSSLSNYVGIGTSTPLKPLHVYGNVSGGVAEIERALTPTVTNAVGYGTYDIKLTDTGGVMPLGTGPAQTFTVQNGSSTAVAIGSINVNTDDTSTDGIMSISTKNSAGSMVQGITIDHRQYVGIDTTTPVVALDVNGTIRQTTVKSCTLGVTTDAAGGLTGCVASDQALKTNITGIAQSGLSIVLGLKPVFYQWKDKITRDAQVHAGFIAQEVGRVFPQAMVNAGTNIKGVDSNAILSAVVKSIRELYQISVNLTRRTETLEKENTLLKTDLCKKDNSYSFCK